MLKKKENNYTSSYYKMFEQIFFLYIFRIFCADFTKLTKLSFGKNSLIGITFLLYNVLNYIKNVLLCSKYWYFLRNHIPIQPEKYV